MDTPSIIRNRLIDLERRYSGPIPRAIRQQASLPCAGSINDTNDIDSCIKYFTWLCASRGSQLRWAARWAIASRRQTGLAAIVDLERFRIACRRLQEARRARDAWLAARQQHGRSTVGNTRSNNSHKYPAP
ncbi:MAG: hypothetical protein OEQ29_09165 [Alphaproteobacteria bacterium]|nr:hypothetical protein [Alphaproteobacteria bacterium]